MKVIEIRDRFGLDRLLPGHRPVPEPGPGEVLLRVRAASLNYRDLLTVRGEYNPRQRLPLIPCSDGAGEIEALGEGATRFAVGDRVTTLFAQGWVAGEATRERVRTTLGGPLDGTLTQWMTLPESGVVATPDHLTDEEAATLPCAALTAWSSLVTRASLSAGDTVLIQGTGGVSLFALQFARALGLRAIVTSSSDAKLEQVREWGAWQTINYVTTPEWGREAVGLTGGRGVDLVVEVGGAGTLAESLRAVRSGGQISLIGVLAGAATELVITPILMNSIRVQGILVGHRDGFEAMTRALVAHAIHPVIDRRMEMAQAREGLEHLAAGRHVGKIVIGIES